jgi:hypothetical protein
VACLVSALDWGLGRAKRCANRQTPRSRPSETAKVKRSRFRLSVAAVPTSSSTLIDTVSMTMDESPNAVVLDDMESPEGVVQLTAFERDGSSGSASVAARPTSVEQWVFTRGPRTTLWKGQPS